MPSMFFEHEMTAVYFEETGTDPLGVPITERSELANIPISYQVSAIQEEITAAAELGVLGYNVYSINDVEVFNALSKSTHLVLPYPLGEFRIVGRVGYVPDGFTITGYCNMYVEQVEG